MITGPLVDQALASKVRVIKVVGPVQDIKAITITTTGTISIANSMVRGNTITKGINSVNSSSNPDIRIIRRS